MTQENEMTESAAQKIWNWWFNTSPKEIAKKVHDAPKHELMKIVTSADAKSAKRILGPTQYVQWQFAKRRLEKMLSESKSNDDQWKYGTPPEELTSKESEDSKAFIAMHQVDVPDEANVDVALMKNAEEIKQSITRRSPMRHNDNDTGNGLKND